MSHFPPSDTPMLSVVIPCYNEGTRFPRSLPILREYLDRTGYPYEILAVDDGSSDNTAAIVTEAAQGMPQLKLLQYGQNRGKGYAVSYGMCRARGQWVLFSDADLSTPISELEKFLPYLDQGYDVVIGSRALAESNLEIRQPYWRERLGRVMNALIRKASGLKFPDTQCGFKLFSRTAAQDIFPNITVDTWMFDVEALVIAQKLGYRVVDLPVTWLNSDESRVRTSHGFRIMRELLHIRLHWLRRHPRRETEAAPGDAFAGRA
ncbi:MAG: dolichyl-phosphate beta-glucosyltransferase [Actinomycetota bacterium]